jgi:hypothetical protein
MKTVSEFFGIPETDFKIFPSDSPVMVFFENRIGFRIFSIGISVVFYRPFPSITVFVENYRICVS